MDTFSKKFKEIVRLSSDLNNIQDYDLLLEKILFSARKFANADAGSIYVRQENELKFSHAQNQTFQNKLPPGRKLIYTQFKIPINKESIAGYSASTGRIVNIANVYRIPKTASYKFNKEYDKLTDYKTKSVLTIPLKTNLGEIIGVLQIINAKNEEDEIVSFNKRDEPYMIHFASSASMVLQRALMTRALLIRMIQMTELRDPKETGAHVNRVASISIEIYERWAKKRNISDDEIEKKIDTLRMAAMLHDVGKIAISDLILKKDGRLAEEEFEIIKTHTILGAALFKNKQSEFDEIASIVALNHHENWDGTGYPGHIDINTGLPIKKDKHGKALPKKGEEIPLFGRIVALADVFDALSFKRVYKEAWEEEEVFKEIKKLSGKKFDPEIVDIFFEAVEEIRAIIKKYMEEEAIEISKTRTEQEAV